MLDGAEYTFTNREKTKSKCLFSTHTKLKPLTDKIEHYVRARINEERSQNRIDSDRLSFLNRYEVHSIWWENTALGSIGKPGIALEIL